MGMMGTGNNSMMIQGGFDDEGRPYIMEGPIAREAWGIFAVLNKEEQFFGSVTKQKNARQICKCRTKRYGIKFYTYKIWTTEGKDNRRMTLYENDQELHIGLAEKVGGFLNAQERATDQDSGGPKTETYRERRDRENEEVHKHNLDVIRAAGLDVRQGRDDTDAHGRTGPGRERPEPDGETDTGDPELQQ